MNYLLIRRLLEKSECNLKIIRHSSFPYFMKMGFYRKLPDWLDVTQLNNAIPVVSGRPIEPKSCVSVSVCTCNTHASSSLSNVRKQIRTEGSMHAVQSAASINVL